MAEFLNINGWTVTHVELALPSEGSWNATISLDQKRPISGKVTLNIGQTQWVGTCDLVGDYSAQTSLRLVGAYGLRNKIKPTFFQNSTVKSILGTIAQVANEPYSTDIDQTVPTWTIFDSTCGVEIERIAEIYGRSWKVDPKGTITVNQDKYPKLVLPPDSYQLKYGKPQEKLREYFVMEPLILPGYTFDGFQIDHVRYWSSSSGNYCRVYTV